MFAPPKEIEMSVFAALPEELKVTGRTSGWAFGKAHASMHSFLEGPAFDRDGNLYVVDIPYGRILRISSAGEMQVVAEYDGWPNGLAVHKDGRIFIADHLKGILALDTGTGKIESIVTRVRREGLKGVNDLTFARNGDLYFTDQGQTGLQDRTGRVYRLNGRGDVDCVLDNIPSPNGLVLSPDEKSLFVAVTRANQIWRLPLHEDGTTSKVAAYITLSGGLAGPDGLAMAADGHLAIAHCGLGTIWIFSPIGEPVLRLRSPVGLSTTNVAFGGADGRRLFVTESDSGSILFADIPMRGSHLYSHR